MRNQLPIKMAVIGAVLGLSAPALAGTASSNLTVNTTVTANCTISTTAVAFGAINTLSAANTDATGTVAVTCTSGAPWSIGAGAGTGTGATLSVRKLTSGANVLNYALYTDSARTTIWGDGVAPTVKYSGTGSGASQTSTIYARVPGSQSTAPTGSYADTVAVTVTF